MGASGDRINVVPRPDWQFGAGYFTGRFGADLFCYRPSEGTLWVGASIVEEFEWLEKDLPPFAQFGFSFGDKDEPWCMVEPSFGWQFVIDVFDGDLWSDVVGYHPSNGTLWLGKNPKPIEGYCWPLSAAPGAQVSFMLSAEGPVSVGFQAVRRIRIRPGWSPDRSREPAGGPPERVPDRVRLGSDVHRRNSGDLAIRHLLGMVR